MAETQEQKIARLAAKQYRNWQEKRLVETGAAEYPKGWTWIDIPKFQDYYPVETIKKFITSAKKYNVDPNDYLAVGIAESGLGLKHPSNPSRINIDVHLDRMKQLYPQLANFREISEHPRFQDISIDYGARYLGEQLGKYKDRLSALQAYSGTGKRLYGGPARWQMTPGAFTGEEKYFGKPSTKINFWKEKPQGKRVAEISELLKKQKNISDYINELAQIAE